jgi:ribonuclease VapC
MIVDTSALIAILLSESEEALFTDAIDADPAPKLSVISRLETTMVYLGRRADHGPKRVADTIHALGLEIVGVDAEQTDRAIDAFLRFGKGRHPARLNLSDCFSYALAASLDEPLLFKGNDFSKTDIVPVWRP